jgi:hypothetical protein
MNNGYLHLITAFIPHPGLLNTQIQVGTFYQAFIEIKHCAASHSKPSATPSLVNPFVSNILYDHPTAFKSNACASCTPVNPSLSLKLIKIHTGTYLCDLL